MVAHYERMSTYPLEQGPQSARLCADISMGPPRGNRPVTPAPDSVPDRDTGKQTIEIQQLLANAERLASTVHRYVEELIVSRERSVAVAQGEAKEFVEEAIQEAGSMLAEADRQAKATLDLALVAASETTRAAREDTEQLAAMNARYRAALETALRAHDGLPEAPLHSSPEPKC